MAGDVKKHIETFNRLAQSNEKFTTSTTVNICTDPKLVHINEQHEWQRGELFRKYEQALPQIVISPAKPPSTCSSTSSIEILPTPTNSNQDSGDLSEDLRVLIEQRVPDLCLLDGEPMEFVTGTKFSCTINDILTSDGEFWVERELSPENEQKFHQFIDILSLFARSYESLQEVYIGQLVALHYEASWHRALVVSKSETISLSKQPSARVRLVDYGSSLYVYVSQLKWLPEQFYLFPFKAMECVFSEAVKPTFSDTVRLTFKQLVSRKRLRATMYDKDGSRLCILLKCRTDEGLVNVYRYLRAHEHKFPSGRMPEDSDIVQCLHQTISTNPNTSLNQSVISTISLPSMTPPSPIQFTHEEMERKREEIQKIFQENLSMNNQKDSKKLPSVSPQSTPFSSGTLITPMSRLSFPPT